MKFYDNGAFYTVAVSSNEVYSFSRDFPCSGLEDAGGMTFQFQSSNGDLVDITGEPEGADGTAVLALSEDAQVYAQGHKKFKARHDPR